MTSRELKNRTAADVRLVAKTLHTYANRIERGDYLALLEAVVLTPRMLTDARDRYLRDVATKAPTAGASR